MNRKGWSYCRKWLAPALAWSTLILIVSVTQGQSPGLRGESDTDNGVVGKTGAPDKSGVFGHSAVGVGVTGRSDRKSGIVGWTAARNVGGVMGHSAEGIGVVGRSDADNGVVGWSGTVGKSGVFGHSERGIGVAAVSEGNDGLIAVTRSSNTGHAAIRARNEARGPAIFVEGDLFVTGAIRGDKGPNGGASYPQPAFVSEWTTIDFTGVLVGLDASISIDHNLGGNPDKYIVDLQFRGNGLGIHQRQYGGGNRVRASRRKNNISRGAWWSNLTNKSITVWRGWSDQDAKEVEQARVRIWTYL